MIPYVPHKIIFTIGDSFALFTWEFFKLACFLFGVYYLYRESRRRKDIDINAMMMFALLVGIGILIGGRLFHFLGPWSMADMGFADSIRALFSPMGGWVIYGGIIFAFVFGYAYLKIKKLDAAKYADLMAPAAMLAFFIGRFACFFAADLMAKQTSLPWAITMHNSLVHPAAIYHALADLIIFVLLLELLRRQDYLNSKGKTKEYGQIFAYGLILYSFFRFIVEFSRIYPEKNYMFGLTMSQNISIVFFVLGIVYLMSKKNKLIDLCIPLKKDIKTAYLLISIGGLTATISLLLINLSFYPLLIIALAGFGILIAGIRKYTQAKL